MKDHTITQRAGILILRAEVTLRRKGSWSRTDPPGRPETRAWGFHSRQSDAQVAHRSGPTKIPSIPSSSPEISTTSAKWSPRGPQLLPTSASAKVGGRGDWLGECGGVCPRLAVREPGKWDLASRGSVRGCVSRGARFPDPGKGHWVT